MCIVFRALRGHWWPGNPLLLSLALGLCRLLVITGFTDDDLFHSSSYCEAQWIKACAINCKLWSWCCWALVCPLHLKWNHCFSWTFYSCTRNKNKHPLSSSGLPGFHRSYMLLVCVDVLHQQSELSCQCIVGAHIHAASQRCAFIWGCHLVLGAGSYIRSHHIKSTRDAQQWRLLRELAENEM